MKKNILYILFLSLIFLYSCDVLDSNNENELSDLELKVKNLPVLADTLSYVGWLEKIKDDALVSAKKAFIIDPDNDGNFSKRMHFDFGDLQDNNTFLVTEEKKNDSNDSIPSSITVLSGTFFGNTGSLVAADSSKARIPSGTVTMYIDVVK